jgi:hypothetical protein
LVISVQKRSKDIFKTDKRDLRCSSVGFDPELEAGVVRVTGLKLFLFSKAYVPPVEDTLKNLPPSYLGIHTG